MRINYFYVLKKMDRIIDTIKQEKELTSTSEEYKGILENLEVELATAKMNLETSVQTARLES